MPRSRAALVTATLAGLLLASLLTAGGAAAKPAKFAHYVALGDSYTSGPLIPVQRTDPAGCARSTSNYPSLLAERLHVRSFTDVSCGGASTPHMTHPQQVTGGVNAPQFDALRRNTDLVTVGIGGNDHNVFGSIVGVCPALRESDPTGSPCKEHFTVDGIDTLTQATIDIGHRVEDVLDGIHKRSPRATVLVVGYPRIAPPTGTCPEILPFADGDYAWVNSVEEALNDALAKAVAEDGRASFVDMYPASLGHDACAGKKAWIQGKDASEVAASYHPRLSGMKGVAGQLKRDLARDAHS